MNLTSLDPVLALDATAQAALIRRGELHPKELLERCIARIERENRRLNAMIWPLYDQALAECAGYDERTRRKEAPREATGERPFDGVPMLLKDLTAEYGGTRFTSGSRWLMNHVSRDDSTLVERFKAAGFCIVGKSNTPEFGLLPTTEPQAHGPTRNPWDTARSPGGSSGGSAAAVAARMVAVGHANDGGGSIRIPAACCGLIGLKPTRGRVSLGPALGDVGGGVVHEHVLTRSVRDSAAILDACCGFDAGAPYQAPPPLRPFALEVHASPGALRIGFSTRSLDGLTDADAEASAAVQHTAKQLEALGHHVEEAPPQVEASRLGALFGKVWGAILAWQIVAFERESGRKLGENDVEPQTWLLYNKGRRLSAAEYLSIWQDLQRICRQLARYFTRYDAWLTPTVARAPAPLGYFDQTALTSEELVRRLGEFSHFTAIANVSGNPAISLPLYWNAKGLPLGSQLIGRYGDEATLIRLAGQLEEAGALHTQPPREE